MYFLGDRIVYKHIKNLQVILTKYVFLLYKFAVENVRSL